MDYTTMKTDLTPAVGADSGKKLRRSSWTAGHYIQWNKGLICKHIAGQVPVIYTTTGSGGDELASDWEVLV